MSVRKLAAGFLGISLAVCVVFPAHSAERIEPKSVLQVLRAAADWQLANPSSHGPRDWTQAPFYVGLLALYGVTRDVRYRDSVVATGMQNGWAPGRRVYHADDFAVSQAYIDLYAQSRKPEMIGPTQHRLDLILANPKLGSLDMTFPGSQDRWSWCDALFMAPPVWAKMSQLTGDKRYLDFMNGEWWATTDYLFDRTAGLYSRDSTYFAKRSGNGKKVFWARGNGWAFAGLALVLQTMPASYPSRSKYLQLFRTMSKSIVGLQQSDGLWRPNLLDSDQIPQAETSGSAFFCYGLAWGVNSGLLDQKKYWPSVSRAWLGLVSKVQPAGFIGSVQPIGAAPGAFAESSTEVYGTGAFLLAGSEVYRHLMASTKK